MPNDYMIAFLHCGLISGMLVFVFESPHSLQEKKRIKIQCPRKDLYLLGRKKKNPNKKIKTHKAKQIFPSKLC